MASAGSFIRNIHGTPISEKETPSTPLAVAASLLSVLANGESLRSLLILIFTAHVNMLFSQKAVCMTEVLVVGVFTKLSRAAVDRARAGKESVLVLEHVVEAVSDVFPDGLQDLSKGEARKAVRNYAALTGVPDAITPIVDFAQDDIGALGGLSAKTASDDVAVQRPEQAPPTLSSTIQLSFPLGLFHRHLCEMADVGVSPSATLAASAALECAAMELLEIAGNMARKAGQECARSSVIVPLS